MSICICSGLCELKWNTKFSLWRDFDWDIFTCNTSYFSIMYKFGFDIFFLDIVTVNMGLIAFSCPWWHEFGIIIPWLLSWMEWSSVYHLCQSPELTVQNWDLISSQIAIVLINVECCFTLREGSPEIDPWRGRYYVVEFLLTHAKLLLVKNETAATCSLMSIDQKIRHTNIV